MMISNGWVCPCLINNLDTWAVIVLQPRLIGLLDNNRLVDTYTSVAEALQQLALANAQELSIDAAISRQSSPSLISKLCMGVRN